MFEHFESHDVLGQARHNNISIQVVDDILEVVDEHIVRQCWIFQKVLARDGGLPFELAFHELQWIQVDSLELLCKAIDEFTVGTVDIYGGWLQRTDNFLDGCFVGWLWCHFQVVGTAGQHFDEVFFQLDVLLELFELGFSQFRIRNGFQFAFYLIFGRFDVQHLLRKQVLFQYGEFGTPFDEAVQD